MSARQFVADPATDFGWRHVDLPERGTTYAYDRIHPSPAASTVVLLHGWTATGALNWATTITALEASHRVVVLDHRGHGRGVRGGEFTLEHCADDAVALLDVLAVGDAIFVGYSMGGPIAQLIWRRHPRRVRGLVLCATAADFTAGVQDGALVQALERVQSAAAVVPSAVRRLAGPLLAVPVPSTGNELLDALASHELPAIHAAGRAIRRFSSTAWIGGVDVPAVVIVTGRDMVVPPARQRELAELIPGSQTTTLDIGHLAPFIQPDRISRAVAAACDDVNRQAVPRWRRRVRRWIARFRTSLRRRR